MGNLWLLIAAPAAVLAAFLFLITFEKQSADQQATRQEQKRDRAEFDRDFAKAFDGRPAPVLEQRASQAEQALTLAEAERARVEAERKAQHEQQRKEIAEMLK